MTWFLVVIDTYAALTAGGSGELVGKLEKQNLIPKAHDLIPSVLTRLGAGISAAEIDVFIRVKSASQRIMLLAARLAKLSKDFQKNLESVLGNPEHGNRQGMVQGILDEMKRLLRYDVAIAASLKNEGSHEQYSSVMHHLFQQVIFPHLPRRNTHQRLIKCHT